MPKVGAVADTQFPDRIGETGALVRSRFDGWVGHGDEARIVFPSRQCQRESLRVCAIDTDTIKTFVAIPEKWNVVLSRLLESAATGPYQ